jgi:serine/threonine-protein kinase
MPAPPDYHPNLTGARARVGTMLRGKWHLDELLGTGGMAAVYAATHRNGSRAAIKVLHSDLAQRPGMTERFVCEGYLANKVGHEGTVRVIDDDQDADGTVFLVMELLYGETLEARRARQGGRLVPHDVLCITERVLGVLMAAHGKAIIHCDLKPENLFVTESGAVKVLDFGIAGIKREASGGPSRKASPAGTPSFMPPEQARGKWEEVDARTDLFAVGASMFTLLTGRYLRELPSHQAQLWAAATEPAPSLGACSIAFAPPLIQLVDAAMAADPCYRFQDASAMREAVRRCWFALHERPASCRLVQRNNPPNPGPREPPEDSGVFARRVRSSAAGQPAGTPRAAGS